MNSGCQQDYLFGLVSGLSSIEGLKVDAADSDKSIGAFDSFPNVRFVNLVGDTCHETPFWKKVWRVAERYIRNAAYAARTDASVFHIQWEDKLWILDRTILILYYRLLGKKIIFTAHNVDLQRRSGRRSGFINRITLWFRYQMVHHIIVHSQSMRIELHDWFGVASEKVSVLPIGILNRTPRTGLSAARAKENLGIDRSRKVLLFFGALRPDKGLDVLIDSLALLLKEDPSYLLFVAGPALAAKNYLPSIFSQIGCLGIEHHVLMRNEFIPDTQIEGLFMAADCVVLPYHHIFQSALPFMALRFGLPVIASAVGGLVEVITEGKTGYLVPPGDAEALAKSINRYFQGPLYANLEATREEIRRWGEEQFNWKSIAQNTAEIYFRL